MHLTGQRVVVRHTPHGVAPPAQYPRYLRHSARPFTASASRDAPGAAQPSFTGTYIKDKERSDSMDEALSLAGMNGLVRQVQPFGRHFSLRCACLVIVMLVNGRRVNLRCESLASAPFHGASYASSTCSWRREHRHAC